MIVALWLLNLVFTYKKHYIKIIYKREFPENNQLYFARVKILSAYQELP